MKRNSNRLTILTLCAMFSGCTAEEKSIPVSSSRSVTAEDTYKTVYSARSISDTENIAESSIELLTEAQSETLSSEIDEPSETTAPKTTFESTFPITAGTSVPETDVTSGTSQASATVQTTEPQVIPDNTTSMPPLTFTGANTTITYLADHSNTDFSFFDDCLFIGDSICMGLGIHKSLLDISHVAAKGGVGSWCIDDYTFQYEYSLKELDCFSIAKMRQPKRIFLWIGMNDIFMCSTESRGANLINIFDRLKICCPNSEIYLVSITPLTSDHKWEINSDGNNRINRYNAAAEELCEKTEGFEFINVHDALLEGECMSRSYTGGDGMHLSVSAYKIVLNEIIGYFVRKQEETEDAVTEETTEKRKKSETISEETTDIDETTEKRIDTETTSMETTITDKIIKKRKATETVSEETTVSKEATGKRKKITATAETEAISS